MKKLKLHALEKLQLARNEMDKVDGGAKKDAPGPCFVDGVIVENGQDSFAFPYDDFTMACLFAGFPLNVAMRGGDSINKPYY